jgi:hypothetical protein
MNKNELNNCIKQADLTFDLYWNIVSKSIPHLNESEWRIVFINVWREAFVSGYDYRRNDTILNKISEN